MAKSFNQCLANLVAAGEMTKQEADDLLVRHRKAEKDLAGFGAGAGDEATEQLAKQLAYEAAEKRRRAGIDKKTGLDLTAYIDAHRTAGGKVDPAEAIKDLFEPAGSAQGVSLEGKRKAILAGFQARLSELLYDFRRGAFTGLRQNIPELYDLVRELQGEATGNARAAHLAKSVRAVFEEARARFNEAGGDIGHIENWFPHSHDSRAVRAAGFETWAAAIRPLLDVARMKNPATGQPLRLSEIGDMLRAVYDNIATESWAGIDPAMQPIGKGALWKRHGEQRFLVFKSAEDWIKYDRMFGAGDPFAAMMRHLGVMARDIAALETFGTNPAARIEQLKQIAQKHHMEAAAAGGGERAATAGNKAAVDIDRLWQTYSGNAGVPVDTRFADTFHIARGVITASHLTGAFITSIGDAGTAQIARHYAGIGGVHVADAIKGMLTYGTTVHEAARLGLMLDSATHVLTKGAREAQGTNIRYVSDFVVDRVLNGQLLQPWTQVGRHVHGMAIMAEVADRAGRNFDQVDGGFARILRRYGIDEAAWDAIRAAPLYEGRGGKGFIRHLDIEDRRAAELYHQLITSEMEYAVPAGSLRVRAVAADYARPGTFGGEVIKGALQFRTFSMIVSWLWGMRRVVDDWQGGEKVRAATTAIALSAVLTTLGAISLQLKNLVKGNDPEPMANNPKFWIAAAAQGGGLGIVGDFLFADQNRYGGGFASTLGGPLAGTVDSFAKLTAGNAQKLMQGKPTHFGREAVNLVERLTPSTWQIKPVMQHFIFDELRRLADPDADRAFSDMMRKGYRERGLEWWWERGERLPSRAPDFSKALGSPPG